MPDDAEGALDHVDLLRLLELIGPLGEHAAALGTDAIGLVEPVNLLDDRQRGLRRGAMATPGRGRRLSVRLLRRRRSLLRGTAEQSLGADSEGLLEKVDLELELCGDLAARLGKQAGQLDEPVVEPRVLAIEKARDLAQSLDVGLPLDVHHAADGIY